MDPSSYSTVASSCSSPVTVAENHDVGSLFARGDWRAPSDAAATVWLEELRANVPDEV